MDNLIREHIEKFKESSRDIANIIMYAPLKSCRHKWIKEKNKRWFKKSKNKKFIHPGYGDRYAKQCSKCDGFWCFDEEDQLDG